MVEPSLRKTLLFLLVVFINKACTTYEEKPKMFERLPSSRTGIYFKNELDYSTELNPYTYRNFFNGGGVGLADFNRDGLLDIFLTGNQVENKLYLNKGNFRFKDITQQAGVASAEVWSTGVSIADVNGDQWPDIYVCKSGAPGGKNRENELFINNGDLTFNKSAAKWGIDVKGLSTDATFFDYDRDGDLDMYLLNNSFTPVTTVSMKYSSREKPDPSGGDRLFRNQLIAEEEPKSGPYFVDVTSDAGIYSSAIGFGLDVLAGDINKDGWTDIYITNDYFERDYLYLNNQDGTFTENLTAMTKSISLSSMGGDIADLTGDGWPELYVTDMLPEKLSRQKTTTTFYSWNDYMQRVKEGFYHQVVRNTLQLNRGLLNINKAKRPDPDMPMVKFSEIGRLTGTYATDWSWAALIGDFDLDGRNDIYVTNGIYKDLTNQDYIHNRQSIRNLRSVVKGNMQVQKLFKNIPSTPVSNYMFHSKGNYNFENKARQWGLSDPGFSNGTAYGDLNNDGTLDLVVNNVNSQAAVYQNKQNSDSLNHWLLLKLDGVKYNTSAIGAQVTLWADGQVFYREQMPNRGYQSSVDPRLHFGLGKNHHVDSLKVMWPSGKDTVIYDISTDKQIVIEQIPSSKPIPKESKKSKKIVKSNAKKSVFRNITAQVDIDYQHNENNFVDFSRNSTLFHTLSTQGPAACTADINSDGLDDLYLGGAKGQAGAIYVQQGDFTFKKIEIAIFLDDKLSEDTACAWFDADGDNDYDLYVGSGGSELPASSTALADRLYLNGGNQRWIKTKQSLPANMVTATSSVRPADFDNDGDIDLFIGTRSATFAYGMPAQPNLLINSGKAQFRDQTQKYMSPLKKIGSVTDSRWFDYDRDHDLDLIISGEWMPLRLFKNKLAETGSPYLAEITRRAGLGTTNGWWQTVEIAELNNDGFMDIIAGNQGLNSMFKASRQNPMVIHTGDFDQNGMIEQIIARKQANEQIPLVLRQDLLRQLPSMRQRFPTFKSYGHVTMDELLTKTQHKQSVRREIYMLESSIFWNKNGRTFNHQPLPNEAQFAPIYAISAVAAEEKFVINLGGNLYGVKPQIGRYDASYGATVAVNKHKEVSVISHQKSGFTTEGKIRSILELKSSKGKLYLVIRNNDRPLWFSTSKK